MKRTVILALSIALTFAVFSQPLPAAQAKADKLSRQQLISLIATAKTPTEHRRIARYYEAQANDFLAQSKYHEEQADAYKKNPMTSASKFSKGTVDHCEYFVQAFKADAAKMHELAEMHEQMAKDAEQK